jgi:asparagine synthase (glutamine-hydrolysing)
VADLTGADDVTVMQTLFSWLRARDQAELVRDPTLEPARRLFERTWSGADAWGRTRIERLTAHAAEINVRLVLPDDYLFKVDAASMRESLEVRVPLLDESVVDFGLSLPHELRVEGRRGKRVLRELARRTLPPSIAEQPKRGFAIPIDTWVDDAFKRSVRERLLDPSCPVAEHFRADVFHPWVDAFARGELAPGISRGGLYQRVIMLLALDLALER